MRSGNVCWSRRAQERKHFLSYPSALCLLRNGCKYYRSRVPFPTFWFCGVLLWWGAQAASFAKWQRGWKLYLPMHVVKPPVQYATLLLGFSANVAPRDLPALSVCTLFPYGLCHFTLCKLTLDGWDGWDSKEDEWYVSLSCEISRPAPGQRTFAVLCVRVIFCNARKCCTS